MNDGFDFFYDALYFGSVTWSGHLNEDFPTDAPKIAVAFYLEPKPYSRTRDDLPVIDAVFYLDGVIDPDMEFGGVWSEGHTFIHDEIIIEITDQPYKEQLQGGSRATGKYTYTASYYTVVAIENLTHPDRKFEYE